ncbi:MAG: homoserine dehydrogenase [Coriobacteriaceae bacterium]|nr:homoserine dehydrogenase [Coriobacteriaceae bacterium]
MKDANTRIGVGVIGLGTVGGGVVRLILSHRASYLHNYGIDLDVVRACSRHAEDAAATGLAPERFTENWREVVADPDVDIVVELIGGEHPAMDIMEAAFAAGKHVVTANKALLGRHVERLAGLAAEAGVQLRCEASVAGGIPVVNALEHALTANEVLTIAGIMNGTTNYILSRMEREGADFERVLADAQRLGYAEADPTADVDGFDAASKTAILASIAFHTRVVTDDVFQEGIRNISAEDIAAARELGYTIKLLGIARNTADGVETRVHPTMIPSDHQLASVSGAMNAVYVVGDAVGETMFYGAGAGSFPTASAVVGDILALAEPMSRGAAPLAEREPYRAVRPIVAAEELVNRFYVRLDVEDADARAAVEAALARHGVATEAVEAAGEGEGARITVLTAAVREGEMAAALTELEGLDVVRAVASVIRVEDVAAWSEGAMEN